MTVLELKKKLEQFPDDMPIVKYQDDNPDYINVSELNMIEVQDASPYGYNYFHVPIGNVLSDVDKKENNVIQVLKIR